MLNIGLSVLLGVDGDSVVSTNDSLSSKSSDREGIRNLLGCILRRHWLWSAMSFAVCGERSNHVVQAGQSSSSKDVHKGDMTG